MAITVAKFLDVANGLQANQFSVGSHDKVKSLDDLDPIYKRLLDEPVAASFCVMGSDGRPNLTGGASRPRRGAGQTGTDHARGGRREEAVTRGRRRGGPEAAEWPVRARRTAAAPRGVR